MLTSNSQVLLGSRKKHWAEKKEKKAKHESLERLALGFFGWVVLHQAGRVRISWTGICCAGTDCVTTPRPKSHNQVFSAIFGIICMRGCASVWLTISGTCRQWNWTASVKMKISVWKVLFRCCRKIKLSSILLPSYLGGAVFNEGNLSFW